MERISASGSGSRGCGSRQPGGAYLCTKLGPNGSPLEDFLVDPVKPFAGEPFRAPILVPDPDDPEVKHAAIWVGESFYPSPVDFIEEVRQKGASRRVPSGFHFAALTPGKSRMIFIHPRAYTEKLFTPDHCPKDIEAHGETEPCLGAHWHYVAALGGRVDGGHEVSVNEQLAYLEGQTAHIGDLSYPLPVQANSQDVPTDFSPGIFLVLPINAVEYEALNREDTGPQSLQQAEDVGFSVSIIDRQQEES